MSRILLLSVCALFGCLLSAPLRADEPKPKQAVDLDRRLAEIEKQLAALSKQVEGLRKDLKPQVPATTDRLELKIFTLKNASAVELSKTLMQFFAGDKYRAVRIVADPRSNCLLVSARTEDMTAIEALIVQLDQPLDKPEKR